MYKTSNSEVRKIVSVRWTVFGILNVFDTQKAFTPYLLTNAGIPPVGYFSIILHNPYPIDGQANIQKGQQVGRKADSCSDGQPD